MPLAQDAVDGAARRHLGLVEDVVEPPDADAVAVLAPGVVVEVGDARRQQPLVDRRTAAEIRPVVILGQLPVFQIERDQQREPLAVRPLQRLALRQRHVVVEHSGILHGYFFNPFSSTNAVQRLTSPAMYFVSAGESASIDKQRALLEHLLRLRRGDEAADLVVELRDDRRRQALRARQPEPDRAVHLRIADLGEGRHILERRDALGRGHRQRHDRAGLGLLKDRQDRRRRHRNVVAEEIRQQRRAAAIGHVIEVGDLAQLHLLDHELAERARAGRAAR